jgi:signal transduction histidine kinase
VPHTVRARLTVTYALLFFAAGTVLLGTTYGLVARSLPDTPSRSTDKNRQARLDEACKTAARTAPPRKSDASGPSAVTTPEACKRAFTAGAAAATHDQRARTLHDLLVLSIVGLAATTLAAAAAGWYMAGRALRPVRAITNAARHASVGTLDERLALQGPRDELKDLADTFDDMLERLERAFANQKRFIADASHELRTPLTVMRTAVDVTLAKPDRSPAHFEAMADKIRRSIDQAQSLIDALLTLASSEREPTKLTSVDLALLADHAIAARADDLADRHLQLDRDLATAPVLGDDRLLERLVANLVDNAIKYNSPDGRVDVATGIRDNRSYLTVKNTGSVIPADEVASLFEPFHRLDERTNSTNGAGIGLAIVQAVTTSHHGLVVANPRDDGGLDVTVTFPSQSHTDVA